MSDALTANFQSYHRVTSLTCLLPIDGLTTPFLPLMCSTAINGLIAAICHMRLQEIGGLSVPLGLYCTRWQLMGLQQLRSLTFLLPNDGFTSVICL